MSQQEPKTPSPKPDIPVGTRVRIADEIEGTIVAIRRPKKYARRYLVEAGVRGAVPDAIGWYRCDELTVPA